MEHFEHKPVKTIEIIEGVPDEIATVVRETLEQFPSIHILTQSYADSVYRCSLGKPDNTDMPEQDFENIVSNIENSLNSKHTQRLFYIQRRSFPANNITIEEVPPSQETGFDKNEHNT